MGGTLDHVVLIGSQENSISLKGIFAVETVVTDSLLIKANTLNDGAIIRGEVFGEHTQPLGDTIDFNFRLNGTIITSRTVVSFVGTSPFSARFSFIVRSLGTNGKLSFHYRQNSQTGTDKKWMEFVESLNYNSKVNNTFDMTAKLTGSDPSTEVVVHGFFAYIMGGG